jgi:hypothetical protein
MANSSTLVQKLPCSFASASFSQVFQYAVVFDTLTSDLTIHTPATGNRAAVVGVLYAEADAHNLIWKSASTTLVTLQMPASSGQFKGCGPGDGAIVIAKVNEALIAQVTTAVISSMLVYVAEISPQGLIFSS